jgi:hypothetical protein
MKLLKSCPVTRETLFQPHFVIILNLCFTFCVVESNHAVSIAHVKWDNYHVNFWKMVEESWRDN